MTRRTSGWPGHGTHVLATDPLDNEVHVFDLATGAFQHTITFSEVLLQFAP